MKGWLFTGTDQPFQLGDIEPPVAGPGEAVLEVKAAGLCHSDVGTMHDPKWLALMNFLPIVMGHEVAGVVTAVGEGVTNVSVGDLTLDGATYRVTFQGDPLKIGPTEFKLLARLVRQAGQVVTHRQLLVDMWGAEFVHHTHYLRLYMAQLRAKLEDNPNEPRLLLNEPGVGYRLAE